MLTRLAKQVQTSVPDLTGLRVAAIALVTVLSSLYGLRHYGLLEPLELGMYDRWVRLSPELPPDPNLLIVSITEDDLRAQEEWPISDRVMAQLLSQLQRYEPSAIGLDIYRDFPVGEGYEALAEEFAKPNVVTIRSLDTVAGTPPPPASPPAQVGFNNIPIDLDNVVRRSLLYAADPDGNIVFAFSLQLALMHLAGLGINPVESEEQANVVKLGESTFFPLKIDSGAYRNLDAGGYQMLLQYRDSEQVAREISLEQALNGPLEPSWVQGKVVLIGSTALSLQDRKSTPYSPILRGDGQTPGVMLHGQMVSQIIDAATGERQLTTFWPESWELSWLVAWALLACGVAWRLRHPLLLLIALTGGTMIILGTGYLLFINGVWIPIAAPVLSLVLTAAVVITYQSYEDHRRQQIVMRLLGQSTSPEIAQALWKGRDKLLKAGKLPGINVVATMLFLDIKGFSTVSECMTPEKLLNWLNDVLSEITEEVLARDGIVNKFTGDGVMAVFGVPLNHTERREIELDAQNAVDCGLSIGDRLVRINQRCDAAGLPRIQMRIGIFTGDVVVGSLGGKDRLEYGVLGDSVNTASRLESCAKERQPSDCRVLIARETLDYLNNCFEVESWGEMALKGKKQMVEVFHVKGRRDPTVPHSILPEPEKTSVS
ncbi:MAG: adenylate/guanylate cyclase domain-containing protein [Spirulina sp. SIO3F2]|nr:adenylate/guanylate cyclase domain-containing protein [Spirulina sp. SIO3F2]